MNSRSFMRLAIAVLLFGVLAAGCGRNSETAGTTALPQQDTAAAQKAAQAGASRDAALRAQQQQQRPKQ